MQTHDWEAELIERLNEVDPGWRERYPDPFIACEDLLPDAAEWVPDEDEEEDDDV